jgi:hypothetical protein
MRPRANAFHFWSPRPKVKIENEEGTPTPVPSPSPKTPMLGDLVKHCQPLIYDSDDECCTSTPTKQSAFFPHIGIRVNTPTFEHDKEELRLKRPQLFRVKTKRDEHLDHGKLDLTPRKHVHFRESYPEKFERIREQGLDVDKINKEALERTPRAESPVPFLSLKEFIKDLKDESPKKK